MQENNHVCSISEEVFKSHDGQVETLLTLGILYIYFPHSVTNNNRALHFKIYTGIASLIREKKVRIEKKIH
jgi:hypothetical protein